MLATETLLRASRTLCQLEKLIFATAPEPKPLACGRQTITWDGLDNNGRKLALAIYFYKLETRGFSQTRKMIILREPRFASLSPPPPAA